MKNLSFFPEDVLFKLNSVKSEVNIDGFYNIYYFEFGKDFSHSPEMHDFWEMVYVDKGEIIAITDGIGCTLTQGQAIFHEPYEIHSHISNKEVANNMLVVSFTANNEVMDFFRKKTFTLDKTARTLLTLFMQEAKNALGKIPNDYENKGPLDFSNEKFGSTQLMQSYFSEFLIKLIRHGKEFSDKISPSAEGHLIAKNSIAELICDYLQKNVYSPLNLSDICSHFLIGKSKLSVLFRDYTGKSPVKYYSELKISEAKKLLREDSLSVSEIADLLCFSGIHNFSRSFKKATGFSPLEYKKSIL